MGDGIGALDLEGLFWGQTPENTNSQAVLLGWVCSEEAPGGPQSNLLLQPQWGHCRNLSPLYPGLLGGVLVQRAQQEPQQNLNPCQQPGRAKIPLQHHPMPQFCPAACANNVKAGLNPDCEGDVGKTRIKNLGERVGRWALLAGDVVVLSPPGPHSSVPVSLRRENKLRIQNGWLCHLAPEIIRQLSPDTEEDKLPFSKHSDVFALG